MCPSYLNVLVKLMEYLLSQTLLAKSYSPEISDAWFAKPQIADALSAASPRQPHAGIIAALQLKN